MIFHLRSFVIVALLAITPLTSFAEEKAEPPKATLPLEDIRLFADVFGIIKNYYVNEVTDKKLIENAIKGMVSGLDPHSTYFDAESFKEIQEETAGEFGGLGLEVTKDPQGVRVVSPIDDTPAAKAGVRAGDIIVKIDGVLTADQTLNQNVKKMRGKPNTAIVLTIARKGVTTPLTIKIVRAIIKVQSVKSKVLKENVGYIRVSRFQERTAEDVAKAIDTLSKRKTLKGIVLDLRNNPGGLLDAAIGVSAVFLPKNTLVVSTRGRTKEDERLFKAEPKNYVSKQSAKDFVAIVPAWAKKIPVVVLINQASASASEIVSGALQDHKRATIMGTRSFGKGSVQTVVPLRDDPENPLGMKITTARYYTPSGRTIQALGITPDIAVDDTPEGNYPTFTIREADLSGHIEGEKGKKEAKKVEESEEENLALPTLRYSFGDEKDFPLAQACAFLLGKHYVTHEETQKLLKEKKATAKKENKK